MKVMINIKIVALSGIIIVVCFFSLYAWASPGKVNVSDFSRGVDKNGIPVGWELLEKSGSPVMDRRKGEEFYYLNFASNSSSFGLKKSIKVDVEEYPYLYFKWMVKKLPKGGDFRKKETDDQAAQVYVVFGRIELFAKMIGYVWDSSAPKLINGVSPAWDDLRIIVLQSGREKLREWVLEKRNVFDDYMNLFGKEPSNAHYISIYINSQHTGTTAESCFAEIFFSKK